MTVAAIADFIKIGVQRAGRHLVQQRLPDVRQVAFDQQDVVPIASVPSTEPRDQLQPSGAAAYDYDLRFLHLGVMRSLSSSRLAEIRRFTTSKASWVDFCMVSASSRIFAIACSKACFASSLCLATCCCVPAADAWRATLAAVVMA